MYILPAVMDKNLIIVSKYTFIFMIILLFAVLSVSIIAIQLFRVGIDDGSEIIIIAKPISRTEVVWGKILVFLSLCLFISGLAAFLCCFTIWYRYGGTVIGHSVTLGAFLGTIVIYLLFGSIAIMLSLIVKKLGTILITVGIFCVLIVYGMVATFTVTTPSKTFTQSEGVNLNSVSLVKSSDSNKKTPSNLTYQWGATTSISPNVIKEQQHTIKGLTEGNYISKMWDIASNDSTYKGVMYTNFLFQYVNLYTLNWHEQFNVPFTVYQTIISTNTSPYITLKFNNVNMDQENSSFKKDLVSLNYKESENSNLSTYYLTNTIRFAALNLQTKKTYITNFGTDYANGSINDLNKNEVTLPWVNSKGFVTETYTTNSTTANPYQEFINTYFNPQVIKFTNKLITLISNNLNDKIKINPLSLYATIFAMSDIDDYMNDITVSQLKTDKNLNKLFNLLGKQVSQFQYWTLLALLNMQKNQAYDAYIGNDQINQMMYCLVPQIYNNQTNVNFNPLFGNSQAIGAWVVAPHYALSTLKLLTSNQQSDKQQALNNIKNNLYGIYPFLNITDSRNLATFTIASGGNFYNLPALVSAWVIISFLFLFIAIALYAKRDFS